MLRPLRPLAFTLILCLASYVCSAQWVAIPDSSFATRLNNLFPQCMQGNNTVGWQMDTTCNAVVSRQSLDCNQFLLSPIHDIIGVQYFDNLEELFCDDLYLTSLPPLPSTLTWLDCSGNQLASLPPLPNSLSVLQCMDNNLTTLPALPSTLEIISCGNNQLTSLPPLPTFLWALTIFNNSLSSLPALPAMMGSLNCRDNQLDSLPALPNSLTFLDCSNNQLTTLPNLPDSLNTFNCKDNPALQCLPLLHKVVAFTFTNTGITCLPNYPISNQTSNPALNTVSVCDLNNSNGCPFYRSILGKVYEDTILNCSNDSIETLAHNIEVQIRNGNNLIAQLTTGNYGIYSFQTDSFGLYKIQIDTSDLPFDIHCPVSNILYDTLGSLDTVNRYNNFGLKCKVGFDLASWSVASTGGAFRPGHKIGVQISAGDYSNFYGLHCATTIAGQVQVILNGPVTFDGPHLGALTPQVNGDTLTYNVGDFGAISTQSDFRISLQTDSNASIGDVVCVTVSVTPTAGDNNSANNNITHCFPVVNSFDPNDKSVYPINDLDVNGNHWLT